MHHVADAVHVDDHEVLAIGVDDPFELADHGVSDSTSVAAGRDNWDQMPQLQALMPPGDKRVVTKERDLRTGRPIWLARRMRQLPHTLARRRHHGRRARRRRRHHRRLRGRAPRGRRPRGGRRRSPPPPAARLDAGLNGAHRIRDRHAAHHVDAADRRATTPSAPGAAPRLAVDAIAARTRELAHRLRSRGTRQSPARRRRPRRAGAGARGRSATARRPRDGVSRSTRAA